MSCNDRVINETIAATGESKDLIEQVVRFQMDFIARKIEEGSFETVRVVNFGTFRAKHRSVQWRDFMKSLPENYRNIIRKRSKE